MAKVQIALIGAGAFNISLLEQSAKLHTENGSGRNEVEFDIYDAEGLVGGYQYSHQDDGGYFLLYTPFHLIDHDQSASHWMAENAAFLIEETRKKPGLGNWLNKHEAEFVGTADEVLSNAHNTRVPRFWLGLYMEHVYEKLLASDSIKVNPIQTARIAEVLDESTYSYVVKKEGQETEEPKLYSAASLGIGRKQNQESRFPTLKKEPFDLRKLIREEIGSFGAGAIIAVQKDENDNRQLYGKSFESIYKGKFLEIAAEIRAIHASTGKKAVIAIAGQQTSFLDFSWYIYNTPDLWNKVEIVSFSRSGMQGMPAISAGKGDYPARFINNSFTTASALTEAYSQDFDSAITSGYSALDFVEGCKLALEKAVDSLSEDERLQYEVKYKSVVRKLNKLLPPDTYEALQALISQGVIKLTRGSYVDYRDPKKPGEDVPISFHELVEENGRKQVKEKPVDIFIKCMGVGAIDLYDPPQAIKRLVQERKLQPNLTSKGYEIDPSFESPHSPGLILGGILTEGNFMELELLDRVNRVRHITKQAGIAAQTLFSLSQKILSGADISNPRQDEKIWLNRIVGWHKTCPLYRGVDGAITSNAPSPLLSNPKDILWGSRVVSYSGVANYGQENYRYNGLLAKTDNFFVTVGVGSFIPSALIFPKQPIPAYSFLDEKLYDEFRWLTKFVKSSFASSGWDPLIFEHGGLTTCESTDRTACIQENAHLHFFQTGPVDLEWAINEILVHNFRKRMVDKELLILTPAQAWDHEEFRDFSKLNKRGIDLSPESLADLREHQGYVFIRHERASFAILEPVGPQFGRKIALLGHENGRVSLDEETWNWRTHPHYGSHQRYSFVLERMQSTAERSELEFGFKLHERTVDPRRAMY